MVLSFMKPPDGASDVLGSSLLDFNKRRMSDRIRNSRHMCGFNEWYIHRFPALS